MTLNYLRDKTVPTYYEWNFNIQRELPRNVLLQVGYVGNKGLNLPNRYDANQAVPFDPLNPLPIPARRPYQTLGFISANSSSTYSNYNGLDVHVERRFSSGLALFANYTWMKNMGIRSFDNYTVMDENNIRRSYGPQGNAHRAVISYIYELPFGPGKRVLSNAHGLAGQVVGGWQINGITSVYSGARLSTASDVNSGTDSRAGNEADATGLAANLSRGQRTPTHWFNTAAFADPPYTRYGNAGEGVVIGPGTINFDIALFKNFRISESSKLQFRVESFNGFNHVNLNNPNLNVSDKLHFGVISSAATARIIQLGLKFYY